MKDSKFIELLNLYVDNQISGGDAARLELEIQQNPRRRQIYRQYCKMQKACTVLAEDFRTDIPPETDSAKVIKLKPERRSFVRQAYVVGSVAAVACLTAALVLTRSQGSGGGLVVTKNRPSTPPAMTLAPNPTVAMARALPPLQLAYTGINHSDSGVIVTSPDRSQFQWMNAVQPRALSLQDVRFEVPATPLRTDDLTFRNRVPLNQQSDYPVALEFRR